MTRSVSGLVPVVIDRSGHRCEAVWHPGYRCRNRADGIHHRLPRSRARHGDEHLLDLADDTDNLAHLCGPCHVEAHANPEKAMAAACSGLFGSINPADLRRGIIVPGYVTAAPDGRPVYTGPDETYSTLYPAEVAA